MRDPYWPQRGVQMTCPGLECQLEAIPDTLLGTHNRIVDRCWARGLVTTASGCAHSGSHGGYNSRNYNSCKAQRVLDWSAPGSWPNRFRPETPVSPCSLNAIVTGSALVALIVAFGRKSGAHMKPVVTSSLLPSGRRRLWRGDRVVTCRRYLANRSPKDSASSRAVVFGGLPRIAVAVSVPRRRSVRAIDIRGGRGVLAFKCRACGWVCSSGVSGAGGSSSTPVSRRARASVLLRVSRRSTSRPGKGADAEQELTKLDELNRSIWSRRQPSEIGVGGFRTARCLPRLRREGRGEGVCISLVSGCSRAVRGASHLTLLTLRVGSLSP